jgi:hypothetical protein
MSKIPDKLIGITTLKGVVNHITIGPEDNSGGAAWVMDHLLGAEYFLIHFACQDGRQAYRFTQPVKVRLESLNLPRKRMVVKIVEKPLGGIIFGKRTLILHLSEDSLLNSAGTGEIVIEKIPGLLYPSTMTMDEDDWEVVN